MSGSSGNGGSGGAPAQPRTIQVLSYNIKLGSLSSLETIAEIILASNADVVGLQEVDKGTERSDGLDEPAVLAQLTGMQAFFAPALHDFDGGQYGEAALVSPELHVVQAIPHDLDQVNSGFETRSAIELRIATSAGAAQPDFVFISTHWEHIHNTGGDQNRAGQAEHVNRIGQAAAALAPALLVGDLNDRDGTEPLDILRQFWTPAREDYFRIDWIFHQGQRWQASDVRNMTDADHPQATTASDHLPVIATYTLMRE